MHSASPHKIKDSTVGLADTSVADARETAGDARKCGPDYAVGIAVVLDVDLHINLEL